MIITSSVSEFAAQLEPADVIIYDSMAALSALIQFFDGVPANHSSLMITKDVTIMANAPGEDDSSQQAVRDYPIEGIVGLEEVHAAIALRRKGLTEDQRSAVVARAHYFLEVPNRFSDLDLMLLGPFALKRAYKYDESLPPDQMKKILTFVSWLAKAASIRNPQDDPYKLFCSELCYRCFHDAGVEMEIPDPLRPPRALTEDDDSWEPQALADANEVWDWLQTRSVDPGVGLGPPVTAENISPGDFYYSPSFEAVAQYISPDRMRPGPPQAP